MQIPKSCQVCDYYAASYDSEGDLIDGDCFCYDNEGCNICEFAMTKASEYWRAYYLMEKGIISPEACEFIGSGVRIHSPADEHRCSCGQPAAVQNVYSKLWLCADCAQSSADDPEPEETPSLDRPSTYYSER